MKRNGIRFIAVGMILLYVMLFASLPIFATTVVEDESMNTERIDGLIGLAGRAARNGDAALAEKAESALREEGVQIYTSLQDLVNDNMDLDLISDMVQSDVEPPANANGVHWYKQDYGHTYTLDEFPVSPYQMDTIYY